MAQVPCDPGAVTFDPVDEGNYGYSFSALLNDTTGSISFMEWAFLGEDFMDNPAGFSPSVTFPGPGTYFVCLQAYVMNAAGMECEAVHCELLPVPVDLACAGLVADFTISLAGDGIAFHDSSSFLPSSPALDLLWEFGDGSTSNEVSPVHDYAGTGPYEACLTVSSGACTARTCNWIYTGPSGVPCTTLLQPSIRVIQYRNVIAAYDRSITSGMNSTLTWHFGDGATGAGNPALHAYLYDGMFQVCGETRLWGPLTPDTCVASDCMMVPTWTAAGMDEGQGGLLRAWPVPFSDQLHLETAFPVARWELLDLQGRVREAGSFAGTGTLPIPVGALAAGTYLLRVVGPSSTRSLRVIKASGPH